MPKEPKPEKDHGIAVNSGTDPQRPGSSTKRPAGPDEYAPGTSAQETGVSTEPPPAGQRLTSAGQDVENEPGGDDPM